MSSRRFGARALPCAALGLAVLCLDARDVRAEQQCISPEAKAAISECPAGTVKAAVTKTSTPRFSSAPVGRGATKTDEKPTNPRDVGGSAQRDERVRKLEKRSVQLLVTEIQSLETLFGDTKKNAPDRPKLARRLAESYVELERAASRDATEHEISAQDARKRKDADAAKTATEAAAKSKQTVSTARKFAIKYYTLLADTYPKWCQVTNASDPSKSTGCGDEVLYYLAYEHEQGKDFESARKVYFELVENWESSQYRPNAYLAFGELYFQEAQSDPSKWQAAELAYQQVLGTPPPGNGVYGYALYKLGYVYWNQGEFEKSVDAFARVVAYGTKFPELPSAAQLASAARKDVVSVYALWGDPKKAHAFFGPISGDAAGETAKTFDLTDRLGVAYLDTGHYKEAIALYTDLSARDRGSKSCAYHGHIVDATLALESGNKPAIVKVLEKQVAVHRTFAAGTADPSAKATCANVTAALLAETAMAWHLEAVGNGGVRGTNDEATLKASANLYASIAANFSSTDFASFTFPRILKEDWPTLATIKYSMADLFYLQKDWKSCGPAFDAVVAEDPKGPDAREAAYAAALCYQNMFAEAHANGSERSGAGVLSRAASTSSQTDRKRFAPRELTTADEGMLGAFNRYVCIVEPDPGSEQATDQLVEIKFARARTWFEARRWQEAALGFRDIAMNHAGHEVGIYAAQLYLESLDIGGTHSEPARPSCYDDMAKDIPALTKLHCEGARKATNAEACRSLLGVERDLGRRRAEALMTEGREGGPGASEKFRSAAQLYLEIWEKYGKEPCQKGDGAGCARSEEVLYNAAQAFQAAKLIAKAIAVRKMLVNHDNGLHETALARKAVYEIGTNYQAIAVYDEAATFYEKFAAESPKDERAPRALSDAVVLRLGLGQHDAAIADAELFQKSFGSRAVEAAQIAFAVGAHFAEREDWKNAEKRLTGAMAKIDQHASVDLQIQAHAMLGRAHEGSGNRAKAKAEYEKVRGFWKDPDAAVKSILEVGTAAGEGEAQKLRRLGKSLEAVGEAFFFTAEQKRAVVDEIVFPRYAGSGERADVERFIKTKVKDWQEKKRKAIEEADEEYLRVLALTPAPPPRWAIASGSRVGQMKGKFVAEFRAAPIPEEWKQNGPSPHGDLLWEEIRGAYYDELDRVSEPDRQAAKAANARCLDLSVKHQYFDEHSRACERWLSKNVPAEYHLIDEFRSAPERAGTGMSERAVPLEIDGSARITVE